MECAQSTLSDESGVAYELQRIIGQLVLHPNEAPRQPDDQHAGDNHQQFISQESLRHPPEGFVGPDRHRVGLDTSQNLVGESEQDPGHEDEVGFHSLGEIARRLHLHPLALQADRHLLKMHDRQNQLHEATPETSRLAEQILRIAPYFESARTDLQGRK